MDLVWEVRKRLMCRIIYSKRNCTIKVLFVNLGEFGVGVNLKGIIKSLVRKIISLGYL